MPAMKSPTEIPNPTMTKIYVHWTTRSFAVSSEDSHNAGEG